MLTQLVLVRHAKSDWGDPSLPDHERPLNARGTRDAPIMAERFAGTGRQVDLILSSTAMRARRTAETFAAALGLEVTLGPALYLAPAGVLLATAQASGSPSVMLVAHNPGITDLASRLSRGEITHMPTCAVARFTWPDGAPPQWHFDSPERPSA